VLYFRVLHPDKAVIQVENYLYGTSQLAQTTLRSICGQAELDELLAERESINQKLQEIIDLQTEPWGVKVRAVELKKIDLATEMQRPMAKQAEAERAKRAKVIHAEGELQAAERLAEAARVLASEEVALQLRYLQTLSKIATEHNSTTIFPVPIDILRPFYDVDRSRRAADEGGGTGRRTSPSTRGGAARSSPRRWATRTAQSPHLRARAAHRSCASGAPTRLCLAVARVSQPADGFRIESIHLRTEGYDVGSPLCALGIAEREDRRRVPGVALAFEPNEVVDSQLFGAIGQPRDDIAELPVLRAEPPGVSMRREVGDGVGDAALVHGWVPPAASSFSPIEGSTLPIAAASDGIEPFFGPEPRRVFQRVQRTVAGAALVARDARVPAHPEHLARFRPALGRAAQRCMESRPVSDSNA
jgi:hypothetical protein